MSNLIVKHNRAGMHTFAIRDGDDLVLHPGVNYVNKRLWKNLQPNKQIDAMIKRGTLEVIDKKEFDEVEAAKLALETYNLEELEKARYEDLRPKVQQAIAAQIKAIETRDGERKDPRG